MGDREVVDTVGDWEVVDTVGDWEVVDTVGDREVVDIWSNCQHGCVIMGVSALVGQIVSVDLFRKHKYIVIHRDYYIINCKVYISLDVPLNYIVRFPHRWAWHLWATCIEVTKAKLHNHNVGNSYIHMYSNLFTNRAMHIQ